MQNNHSWEKQGNWYKGNLHTHTDNSDGALSIEELIEIYKQHDYDFLGITDHNKLTNLDKFKKGGMLLIPGEEITSPGKTEAGQNYHIVVLNPQKEIDLKKCVSTQAIINEGKMVGGEVIIPHPYWSGCTNEELFSLTGYLGIEIYNSLSDCFVGKGYALTHWDALLNKGRKILGIASDDCHHKLEGKILRDTANAFIMVKVDNLDVESIMEAVKAGDFYSSNGPEIKNISIQNDSVIIQTSPVKGINIIADTCKGRCLIAEDNDFLTEVIYKLKGNEEYIRIECYDENHRWAWSQPFFNDIV